MVKSFQLGLFNIRSGRKFNKVLTLDKASEVHTFFAWFPGKMRGGLYKSRENNENRYPEKLFWLPSDTGFCAFPFRAAVFQQPRFSSSIERRQVNEGFSFQIYSGRFPASRLSLRPPNDFPRDNRELHEGRFLPLSAVRCCRDRCPESGGAQSL